MSIAFTRHLWLATPMMRGEDIFNLQILLATALGRSLDQDGIYGLQTKRAVLDYQRGQGLTVDGIVGAATWNKLNGTATATPDYRLEDVLGADAKTYLTTSHRRYQDGRSWLVNAAGVVIDGEAKVRDSTAGDLQLVRRVRGDFTQALVTSIGPGPGCTPVPVELIIATICTESSGNTKALRKEPGCDLIDPERTPHRVSAGLMQTLLSTAREARDQPQLRLNDLYVPKESIAAGAAYIWRQARTTRFDPPLVAAAYNAGGIYYNNSSTNPWRVRQYPIGTSHHVDRFVRFFNAAMADSAQNPHPAGIPSLCVALAN
ncbi:peptidoglycan-binding protein [Steroidobacter sp.]|uniref:peptidoglycan-binding protein n=1 Tax=Steroidobacter sp. TaxID=1978227 RepID=UPI001A625EED|nr:peptidoglycan-binding protein [Steroidobacter sp.]MBL8266840.1 transglycosylase SLT domain-containing protein [Steroidobacter sp.]